MGCPRQTLQRHLVPRFPPLAAGVVLRSAWPKELLNLLDLSAREPEDDQVENSSP